LYVDAKLTARRCGCAGVAFVNHLKTNIAVAVSLLIVATSAALAQARRLRVVSTEGHPIPFADVTVGGGENRITDESGVLVLSVFRERTLSVRVRRIGYSETVRKLDLSDTVSTFVIALSPLPQRLNEVTVSGNREEAGPTLQGFYHRWLQRQQGALSAVFIGPEELEARHPSQISDMLYGLNGITMRTLSNGDFAPIGTDSHCPMTVLLDGEEVIRGGSSGNSQVSVIGGGAVPNGQNETGMNRWIEASHVAAIEVYARGGNMPISLQVRDPKCGVIAVWTGGRHP
jgi:hypothetical protein